MASCGIMNGVNSHPLRKRLNVKKPNPALCITGSDTCGFPKNSVLTHINIKIDPGLTHKAFPGSRDVKSSGMPCSLSFSTPPQLYADGYVR